jgi:hypothetical protein
MTRKKAKILSVALRLSDGARQYFRTAAEEDKRSLTAYLSIHLEDVYKQALQRRDPIALSCSSIDFANGVQSTFNANQGAPCPPPAQSHSSSTEDSREDDFIPVSKNLVV